MRFAMKTPLTTPNRCRSSHPALYACKTYERAHHISEILQRMRLPCVMSNVGQGVRQPATCDGFHLCGVAHVTPQNSLSTHARANVGTKQAIGNILLDGEAQGSMTLLSRDSVLLMP